MLGSSWTIHSSRHFSAGKSINLMQDECQRGCGALPETASAHGCSAYDNIRAAEAKQNTPRTRIPRGLLVPQRLRFDRGAKGAQQVITTLGTSQKAPVSTAPNLHATSNPLVWISVFQIWTDCFQTACTTLSTGSFSVVWDVHCCSAPPCIISM